MTINVEQVEGFSIIPVYVRDEEHSTEQETLFDYPWEPNEVANLPLNDIAGDDLDFDTQPF